MREYYFMDDGQARWSTSHEARIRAARAWVGVAYGLAIGASAAAFVLGLRPVAAPTNLETNAALLTAVTASGYRQAMISFGLVGIVASIITLPISMLLIAIWRESGYHRVTGIEGAMSRFMENSALSDDARRVIYRKQEREMLCKAIEEDISVEDWEAASVLVGELANRFGYRADAEEFRTRIESARRQTVDRKVADAISLLDGMIIQHRWDDAALEAARIRRVFPESIRTENLAQRVQSARDVYIQEIERSFLVAAQEDRVEDAMRLLKEIDLYLTESQAAPFREVARGVIGKARENLGVQFKLAVQDRRWRDAALAGDKIIKEFPNSRMAAEVRGLIDGIRTRATQVT
jgi:hypothetical protein